METMTRAEVVKARQADARAARTADTNGAPPPPAAGADPAGRPCEGCGKPLAADAGRARYHPVCAAERKRERDTIRKRKLDAERKRKLDAEAAEVEALEPVTGDDPAAEVEALEPAVGRLTAELAATVEEAARRRLGLDT